MEVYRKSALMPCVGHQRWANAVENREVCLGAYRAGMSARGQKSALEMFARQLKVNSRTSNWQL